MTIACNTGRPPPPKKKEIGRNGSTTCEKTCKSPVKPPFGPCLRKDFKGQRSSKTHKMLLFVSWRNKYAIIEWPLFDAPSSTHGVFTSFSLSRCCCLHFCRNKFGFMLAQGYFKGQWSSIIHKLQLFMTLCDMQTSSGNYSMRHQVPMVFLLLLIYLSAVAYISVEISLGSCLRRDILRVSSIIHKLQFFMTLCDMQSSSGNYSMRHQVSMVSLLILDFSLSK